MRRIFTLVCILTTMLRAQAQITITASDMPVSGDTLRYSNANIVGNTINLADSGAGFNWNYSDLVPVSQNVDTYKTALSVNLAYALISFTAYGYKVSDSFPGASSFLPVSINQLYTFFEKKTSPSRFSAVAFAAKIGGLPTPFNYTIDDDWYYFPLTYHSADSSRFSLTIGLSGTASLKQTGYRKTTVDGWGTITTPYYTSPVNCIRVRSFIREIDSVSFSGFPFTIPRTTVEYKWLVNGGHYPALWVTANKTDTVDNTGAEVITSIRYRDIARQLNVGVPKEPLRGTVKVFPNPAVYGRVTLDVPADWNTYSITIYDQTSKAVMTTNKAEIDMSNLPAGMYVAQVIHNADVVYAQIVR